MKIVIALEIDTVAAISNCTIFAHVIAKLREQAHRITVVQGSHSDESLSSIAVKKNGNGACNNLRLIPSDAQMAEALGEALIRRKTVAVLSRAGIPSFFLCPNDGRTVRVRRRAHELWPAVNFEAAAIDPFWIETISNQGGVPVIADVFLGYGQEYHRMSSDQLAAKCAIDWQADLLVFLTKSEVPRPSYNSIALFSGPDDACALTQDGEGGNSVAAKMSAVAEALKYGVKRVTILPASRMENLFLFARTYRDNDSSKAKDSGSRELTAHCYGSI